MEATESYRAPSFEDLNYARWLRTDLQATPGWDHLLTQFSIKCHSQMGHGNRPDSVKRTRDAFSILLPNLHRAHRLDPNLYLIVDRSSKAFPNSVYNPVIGSRGLKRALDYLIDKKLVEKKGGNKNRETDQGYVTRIRASDKLIKELDGLMFGLRPLPHQEGAFPVTRNTFVDDPHSISSMKHYNVRDLPLIRLKRAKGDLDGSSFIKFDATDETRTMDERLTAFNKFLTDHWVDLFIPDQKLQQIDPELRLVNEDGLKGCIDIAGRRSLYRVFNNGAFNQGGRFYGGWWQDVPSRLRQYVTINWYTTAELDFSAIQLNMLYALEGMAPPEFSYALPGFPNEYRNVLKTAFFKLINAKSHVRPIPKANLPQGWTWKMVVDGLRQLHAPIEKHFSSGIGIELQRKDSDVAEKVMIDLMDENILALPVHDSFIVIDGNQNRLREVMLQAYRAVMKQDIGISVDTTWLEENLPADASELNELGVRFLDDYQADVEQSSEYERYRQRRSDFLSFMGEPWGHRHSFFR
jgi:hypothetical protein